MIENSVKIKVVENQLEKEFNMNIDILKKTPEWSVDTFGNDYWTFRYSGGECTERTAGFPGKMIEFRGEARYFKGLGRAADLVFTLEKDLNIVSVSLFVLADGFQPRQSVQSMTTKGHFPTIKPVYVLSNNNIE